MTMAGPFVLDADAQREVDGAGRNKRPLTAYYFLRQCADTQHTFTIAELNSATCWKGQTASTYVNKQWEQLLIKTGVGSYSVRPEFRRIRPAQFLRRFTQKKPIYSEYYRRLFGQTVIYEFLLPLTRETQLRDALDELFYKDALEQRVGEIGFPTLETIMLRADEEDDDQYTARVISEIDHRFGGYSITHVDGRFRAADLVTRGGAGDMLATGDRYLIDETTASVRFIVPCQGSLEPFESDYRSVRNAILAISSRDPSASEAEVGVIRGLFFNFFVEAVVKSAAQQLSIYRDWKMLRVLQLDPVSTGYRFNARFTRDERTGLLVEGTIAANGEVSMTAQTQVGPPICPICLARGTQIATPEGPIPVEALRAGMTVWTEAADGLRERTDVLAVANASVPPSHQMVHLMLAAVRELLASPAHPLADGRPLAALMPGDAVDGSTVVTAELEPYQDAATFDLLPAGPTARYWANGIPLSSTLTGP